MIEPAYLPHHRRIEQVLRERITAMQPGDRLPSDAELVAEFGVSRMTARNAMQRLAEEGLVARQPGRGSFVTAPHTHRRTDRLMTFSSEMVRRGRVPSSRLLARAIRPSTRAEAGALLLARGEPVVEVRRIRLADGEPIALETAILVASCASSVLTADLEHGSLHAAITAGGQTLRRGTGTVSAAAATAEDARLLDVRRGDPLLVERRVIVDDAGRRIESTESRYPADRYALDVSFDVEQASSTEPEEAR
ncbi:MAG TPA: GntR family transcriptional regulator [Candidatus Limnocylindrales bacterium]|nr:GntR family transcriptional regulator [Candidatus Limnocylindrales bacterium]